MTTTEVRIKDCNHLTEAAALFHWCAFGLCWCLDIGLFWQVALSLVVLCAMWRTWSTADAGLRCLWLEPGDGVRADVGGLLRRVKRVEVGVSFSSHVEFVLHCADGERVRARVFEFGVTERAAFRQLCRRLNAGVAW